MITIKKLKRRVIRWTSCGAMMGREACRSWAWLGLSCKDYVGELELLFETYGVGGIVGKLGTSVGLVYVESWSYRFSSVVPGSNGLLMVRVKLRGSPTAGKLGEVGIIVEDVKDNFIYAS